MRGERSLWDCYCHAHSRASIAIGCLMGPWGPRIHSKICEFLKQTVRQSGILTNMVSPI